jgi:hypothetical protein
VQINNDFREFSCAILDARYPDTAYFRVSGIAPGDLSAYLAERGVHAWGAFWRDDHTIIRCQHGQAGYVVALLDGAGLAYTTSYQPVTQRRPRRKRGGLVNLVSGLVKPVSGWW